MNRSGRKRTAILGDLKRLIAPLDVLYTVGSLIYKRSLRYTVVTAGIALVGMMAGKVGLPGFTVRQAIVLPLMIGGLSLIVGTLLKVVPSLIASRLLTVAQGSDLNLMEDYRKSQADEHLNALWDRLYLHEARLRLAGGAAADADAEDILRPGETETEALARAKSDFFQRAGLALASHLPQIQQMHRFGLDLRYLEDWRDGAYLDRSDTKLIEQFNGNATLLSARAQARMNRPAMAMLFNPRRVAQRFWFLFITRMIAIQVASAVQRLNRAHGTDLFNAQVLLWPGTEDSTWLADLPGARENVLAERTRAVRRVFGEDLEAARDVLDRMLTCCFAVSTELRMRYDPDYCDGAIGYDVLGDLQREGRNRRDFQRAGAFVRRAVEDLESLREFLGDHRPELLDAPRGRDLRAARIALHVDRDGLRRALRRHRRGEVPAEDVTRRIDYALADRDRLTRCLIATRMHHELTRLNRQGYWHLVKTLGYSEEAEAGSQEPGARSREPGASSQEPVASSRGPVASSQ